MDGARRDRCAILAEAVRESRAVDTNTPYIERGNPWENGYIESFNARHRDELLDGEIFYSLRKAKPSSRVGGVTTTGCIAGRNIFKSKLGDKANHTRVAGLQHPVGSFVHRPKFADKAVNDDLGWIKHWISRRI